jgi:hypothetical protein
VTHQSRNRNSAGQRDRDVADLRRLPDGTLRFVAMARAPHPTRDETLGAYYRLSRAGKLGPMGLIEVDQTTRTVRVLRQSDPRSHPPEHRHSCAFDPLRNPLR